MLNRKIMTSQAPSSALHFEEWIGILDIEAQLNSLKSKCIQRLLNITNVLWKDLMLYRLNLTLNSNQGLALFRKKQNLKSNRHKNLQKRNNEDLRNYLMPRLTYLHVYRNCY